MLIGLQFLPTMERVVQAAADLLEGEDVESVERLILVVLVVSQPEYKILVGFGDRQSPNIQSQTVRVRPKFLSKSFSAMLWCS